MWILFLVGYTCTTNMYYVAFAPPTDTWRLVLDQCLEGFFYLDFVFNFFQGFRHEDTYEHISDFKAIAKKYLFGWLIIDFVSIFPFPQVIAMLGYKNENALGLKLIRLLRLPRMAKLIDINRIKNVLKSLGGNTNNDEEIVKQYYILYFYKMIRMIIIALIITYFLGCIWFYISNELQADEKDTWYKRNKLAEKHSQIVISCYFALTTLSTVGYGDFYPISSLEMITTVVVMMLGVAFFSYIMGNFIEIMGNQEKKMGAVDKSEDFNEWLTGLTRFTMNQPLPNSLHERLLSDMNYQWSEDRNKCFQNQEEYCP